MMRYLLAVGLAFGAVSLIDMAAPAQAAAATYYVDGSCSANGNGTGDGCASAAGGSGAWRDPATCFANVRAGDTCYIKNGTYYTSSQGSDTSENGGFSVAASGTSGSPIVIRNYPGHTPMLANCATNSTSYSQCARATITMPNRSYVTIQGLRIHGGVWIYGASPVVGQGSPGIVIKDNEITQGWGEVDDGNWAALFLENLQGALIQNNYIHNVSVLSGGGQQSSGSCVKLYQNTDTIVELNTCRTVPIAESQAGGIDDKAQAVRNVHRYNWIQDVNVCVRINNQLVSTGVQIYGNVCIGSAGTDRPGVRLIVDVNGIDIHNNTFIGFGQGLQVMSEGGPVTGVKWYNNIVSTVSGANIEAYQVSMTAPSNYNAYVPNHRFLYGGSDSSNLAAFRSATGFDANGAEVDCQLVAPTYNLASGSACRGAGRVGGTSSGAAIDRGAYGVTSCVGQNCAPPTGGGGGGTPTAPGAPTGVRIVSN